MLVGLAVDSGELLPNERRAAVVEAARLGFVNVWTPSGTSSEAFQLCIDASRDGALRVGISAVPVLESWRVDRLAEVARITSSGVGGKFVLGVGAGLPRPTASSPPAVGQKPVAAMRRVLTELRLRLAATPTSSAVPVHLAALGPRMLALAGEAGDGALLNWATPERIGVSRRWVQQAAISAGRDPRAVPLHMYVRFSISDDVERARMALGRAVLRSALAWPGIGPTPYSRLFQEMGFSEVIPALQTRCDAGESLEALAADVPEEMLSQLGYYGSPAGALAALNRLAAGLDEVAIRVLPDGSQPALDAFLATVHALSTAQQG